MMHPSCPYPGDDCRIIINSRSSSQVAGLPIFNGFGQLVSQQPDPGTYVTHYVCMTCKAAWSVKQRANQPDVVFTNCAPQPPP